MRPSFIEQKAVEYFILTNAITVQLKVVFKISAHDHP